MQKDILFKGQTPNIKHEGDLCLLEFSSHTREKLIRRVGLSPYLPSFSLSLVNYHPPPLGCCIAGSQAMVTDQGSKEIDWKAVGKWSLGWGGAAEVVQEKGALELSILKWNSRVGVLPLPCF